MPFPILGAIGAFVGATGVSTGIGVAIVWIGLFFLGKKIVGLWAILLQISHKLQYNVIVSHMLSYSFSQDSAIHHNTHVANASNEVLLIQINGPDGTVAEQQVKTRDVVNFGTIKGQVQTTVYKADKPDSYEARRELPSDISVLVREDNGHLQIVRVKYGTLWQEDE